MGVLVGRSAPDFTAAAVTGSGEIVDNFNATEVPLVEISPFSIFCS